MLDKKEMKKFRKDPEIQFLCVQGGRGKHHVRKGDEFCGRWTARDKPLVVVDTQGTLLILACYG